MELIRGSAIGRGSFGSVNLVIPGTIFSELPQAMVVKSCLLSTSDSIKNEKEVLSQLGNHHPQIVRMFGDSTSFEKGVQFYNLFLEYAVQGSLADQMKISGGSFTFSDVKKYTSSILKGLSYIHQQGFVHGDIKLQNVLLFENGEAKIADFGLAKRVLDCSRSGQLRGTPLYMSPEIVAGGDVGSPADIWALGCAVVEMVSGKPAWRLSPEVDVTALLYRIGIAGECPGIPGNLCDQGKDFLGKCFTKDPNARWTARMLLDHPFISGFENVSCLDYNNNFQIAFHNISCSHSDEECVSVSPRCPLEFPDCESSYELESSLNPVISLGAFGEFGTSFPTSVLNQFLVELDSDGTSEWCDNNGWVVVR